MKKFFVLTLIAFAFAIGCDQEQNMIKPVIEEVVAPDTSTKPVEPETVEYTYYVDGVLHTGIAYLTADAALATEKYQNLLEYYQDWNHQNCGKPSHEQTRFDWDRVDDFLFYFTTFEEMDKFDQITQSHRDIKQYAPEDAPIPEEENGVWGIFLAPDCL